VPDFDPMQFLAVRDIAGSLIAVAIAVLSFVVLRG
jgi:hypothetical protein